MWVWCVCVFFWGGGVEMGSVGCYPIFIFIDLVFHHNNTLACFKNQRTFIGVLFVLYSSLSCIQNSFPWSYRSWETFSLTGTLLGCDFMWCCTVMFNIMSHKTALCNNVLPWQGLRSPVLTPVSMARCWSLTLKKSTSQRRWPSWSEMLTTVSPSSSSPTGTTSLSWRKSSSTTKTQGLVH